MITPQGGQSGYDVGSTAHAYASDTPETANFWGHAKTAARRHILDEADVPSPSVFRVSPLSSDAYEDDPDTHSGYRSKSGWRVEEKL